MCHQQECDRGGSTSSIIPTTFPTGSSVAGCAAQPGHKPTAPRGDSSEWGQPVPCPWLQDHQASDVSGIAAGFALPCPPKKSTTQDPLTALYIPPAVRFSRRHESCLYYQDFLRHTVPSLKGPFSQTIEKTGIKFPKYPSF